MKKFIKKVFIGFGIIVLVLFIILLIIPVSSQEEDQTGAGEFTTDWAKYEKQDDFDGLTSEYWAITSIDYQEFDFPYEGKTYASIIYDGQTFWFSITRGQIIINEGLRERSEKAGYESSYDLFRSADGSTNIAKFYSPIQIMNYDGELKIQATIYQEGRRTWTFKPSKPLESLVKMSNE